MPSTLVRPVVLPVVTQHVEDSAALRNVRSGLLRSPHTELRRLARLDERIAAHLDGCLVAGDTGYRLAVQALERPGPGQIFLVAVLALQRRDHAMLDRLLALVPELPDEAPRALASALGWVDAAVLRGLTVPLLQSGDALHHWLGLAACATQRVDPGPALAPALQPGGHALLLGQALRTAAQLGRCDLLGTVAAADAPPPLQGLAWQAAVLLGDRGAALKHLQAHALAATAQAPSTLADQQALQLALLASAPAAATALAQQVGAGQVGSRCALRAAGWSGDLGFVPWLLDQMEQPASARPAGEAFTQLTGADLAWLDLDLKGEQPPATLPSDKPDEADVAMDEDDSLPWPQPAAARAWWQREQAGLPGAGVRVLAGAPADAATCQQVLKVRGQRLRQVAALRLALQQPGSVLFNTAAPSPRQQRALGLPVKVI